MKWVVLFAGLIVFAGQDRADALILYRNPIAEAIRSPCEPGFRRAFWKAGECEKKKDAWLLKTFLGHEGNSNNCCRPTCCQPAPCCRPVQTCRPAPCCQPAPQPAACCRPAPCRSVAPSCCRPAQRRTCMPPPTCCGR